MKEDHKKAKELEHILKTLPWVESVEPVETNIIIFKINETIDEKQFLEKLKNKNIHISSMGHGKLRIVTHMDYKEVMHTYVKETLEKLF